MIKAEQIPDEVVEAVARVVATVNEPIDKWMYHVAEARAAIAAALAAWPGADYRPGAKVTKTWTDPGKIILPIKETPNAK